VFVLNPTTGEIGLPALGLKSIYKPKQVQSIKMIGSNKEIKFNQTDDKLMISVPAERPNQYAAVFEVHGAL